MKEKISVIIPVYNSADKIQKCLASVFNQTYNNLEVIVIDDGSTDNLLLALTNCKNKLTILHQENKGAPAARNYGFKIASGAYVIFLDADIVLAPQALEKMYLALKADAGAVFAYSRFKFGWKTFKLWPFDYAKLKTMPYIHTSALIRKEKFPGFDESLKKFQDWDLFLTIAEAGGRGVFVPEVLFKVASGGTMSSWLPKFVYDLSWLKLASKTKYETAKEIIKKKHKLL
jgi:glycosyltransferase involved in cell wall biosynthesis